MYRELSQYLSALIIIFFAPVALAQPASSTEQKCAAAIQNKIAWNYKGDKRWATGNIKKLCAGAENSAEPARCFEHVMHGGVDWGGDTHWNWRNALALCKGSRNAISTIGCFERRIGADESWRQAIDSCHWGASHASERTARTAKPVTRARREPKPPTVKARRVESKRNPTPATKVQSTAKHQVAVSRARKEDSNSGNGKAVDWNEYKKRDWGYLKADSGLCLTVNVFDRRKTRKQKIKGKFKKAFDPREHLKAVGVSDRVANAMVFGPAGPEMAGTVVTLRQVKKIKEAWQGDLKQRMGLTLLRCGSVASRYQGFRRHKGGLLQVGGRDNLCLSNRKNKNGGRAEIHNCKTKKWRAWYFNSNGTLRNGKGRCLDVRKSQLNDEGARVQMWECNGQRQQRWTFTAS